MWPLLLMAMSLGPQPRLDAQSGAALTGEVSSEEEGTMEGVAVTAEREGASFRVSVYSDANGRYAFPRSHLVPGTYTLTIRAAGYDLVLPGPADVPPSGTATLDLTLKPTADITQQLSSREWALSMPGPDEIKNKLVAAAASCTYCHSVERILKSRHTVERWMPVLNRMHEYFLDGSAAPQGTGRAQAEWEEEPARERNRENPDWWPLGGIKVPKAELAEYLASVNLSGGRTEFPYELKPLPRAKGPATRIIVTTWDVPRKTAVIHDSEVDSQGRVWFNSENDDVVGMLDPKTNTFAEYPLERPEPNAKAGSRDIIIDRFDNVWLPMRLLDGAQTLYGFNTSTHEVTRVEGFTGGAYGDAEPDGSHVWLSFVRVDARTGKLDRDFRRPATGVRPGGYGFVVGSAGNPYGTSYMSSGLTSIDVTKDEGKAWSTPRPHMLPRRGRMDAQDRFWLAFYGGNALAMFDTRSETWSEWQIPVKFSTPYTVTVPDRNGYVYSPSHTAEVLFRLNPTSGEILEYPMPTTPGNFDTKKMAFDPTAEGTVLLFANTRNAQIMRVEFLD